MSAVTAGNVDLESSTPTATTTTARSVNQTSAPVDRSGWPVVSSLSFVIPVYNEEGNLSELHRRITEVMAGVGLPYEFILVDDGSKDGTWNIIRQLRSEDDRVVALRHRRNFGKARALSLGFSTPQVAP